MTTSYIRRPRRAVARAVALVCVLACTLVVGVATAGAHAQLRSTSPPQRGLVKQVPSQVKLTFNENVHTPFGGVRVFGPDGKRVDSGKSKVVDHVINVPIDSSSQGTYAVAYRIVSADGHPVRGAYTFDVGKSSSSGKANKAALQASTGNRGLDIAMKSLRGIVLLMLIVAAGGALFSALVAPLWKPRWYRTALAVAIVCVAGSYVVDAAIAGGFSFLNALRWSVLNEEAQSAWGRTALLIGSGATASLVTSIWFGPGTRSDDRNLDDSSGTRWRANWPAIETAVLPVITLLTGTTGGHAMASGLMIVRMPLDMLHQLAAAMWIGGLIQLVLYLRSERPTPWRVERFSRLAFLSVITLVITGTYASYVQIGLSLDAWTSTTYGQLVLVKIGLLLLTMPIAYANRSRIVPVIAGSVDGDPVEARARLARYARIEIGILVLVIAATGWLVQSVPAKDDVKPKPFSKTLKLANGATLEVDVTPATVGRNDVHVYAFTPNQQPDSTATNLVLTGSYKKRGIDTLDLGVLAAGPGHWSSPTASLPFAGTWTFRVSLERGKFTEEHQTFRVPIAPAGKAG